MDEVAQTLRDWFGDTTYVVAFSGGVDSAVVLKAASLASAEHRFSLIGVTATSPSVPERDLSDADALCRQLEVTHVRLRTDELDNPFYQRNDARRCYFCKATLFQAIRQRYPDATIVTGTNRDDLGDYRPGLEAAAEAAVRSPLAELGFTKADVRQLASYWGLKELSVKPASPCLASRLAYGVAVTPDRLRMVQAAESFLEHLGFRELRVRFHDGAHARVEVLPEDIDRLVGLRHQVSEKLHDLGFEFVSIDLDGFRSGSLNRLVQLG